MSERVAIGRRRVGARRRGLLLPLLLVMAWVAPLGAAPLRLVSDTWPPFTGEVGQPRVALALVHRALERTGREAETRILEAGFAEVLESIARDEADGSAALWRTPEREKSLIFSKPYLENRLVLVGRAGSDVDLQGISQLAGRRVGVVSAYAYRELLDVKPGPILVESASDTASLRRLLDGEVDYVLADELLIHHLVTSQAEQAAAALAIGRFPLVSRSLHFAVRRDLPDAEELVRRFDDEIRTMMSDGSYHEILDVDWLWADLDGDGKSELILGGVRAGTAPPTGGYGPLSQQPVPAQEEPPDGYVVEGVVYDGWDTIPERYKVDIDRTRMPVDPAIPVFRF